jgi:hypothetical protein
MTTSPTSSMPGAQNIEHVEVFARGIVGLLRMTPAK